MSKYILYADIGENIKDLIDQKIWLEKDTTIRICKSIRKMQKLDIIHCEECRHRKEDINKAVSWCALTQTPVEYADFCSKGEYANE